MKRNILLIIMAAAGAISHAQNMSQKLDSILVYNGNNSLLEKSVYAYDSLSNLVSKVVDSYLWKTKSKYVYENNDKGFQVSIVQYDWDKDLKEWIMEKKTLMEYEADGTLAETAYYLWKSKSWNLLRSEHLHYDKRKNEIVTVGYNSSGKEFQRKRTAEKYSKKILASKSEFIQENNKWREAQYHLYKHDSENRLAEEEHHEYTDELNPLMYKYIYKYDSKGRLKRKETYISSANKKEWAFFNYALYFYQ